jgi:hypothetical protein
MLGPLVAVRADCLQYHLSDSIPLGFVDRNIQVATSGYQRCSLRRSLLCAFAILDVLDVEAFFEM